MRYRLMAIYDGSTFEAGIGPTEDDIVLFAACPPPEELDFEPATGHWRKQVRFSDVEALWESRPVGAFRGERCLVLDDLGDRLHIGYLGRDGVRAAQLGYWQVDRGVFELIAPRSEVSGILEQRVEVHRLESESAADSAPAEAAGDRATAPDYLLSAEHPSGPITGPGFGAAVAPPAVASAAVPAPDDKTGVALPTPPAAPLPLEAAAMRAASGREEAGIRPAAPTLRPPKPAQPSPARISPAALLAALPSEAPAAPPLAPAQQRARHHRATRRKDTGQLFADLASLAGIPADSYALGEEVDGAWCLIEGEHGVEVFRAANGARHEIQTFATEESACFYLFGVLAADAVRSGALARVPSSAESWQSQTA